MAGDPKSLPDADCLDLGGQFLSIVTPVHYDIISMDICPTVADCTKLGSCSACTQAQCMWSAETQSCTRIGTRVKNGNATQRVCQGSHPKGGCGALLPSQCPKAEHRACPTIDNCADCSDQSGCSWCISTGKCVSVAYDMACMSNCPDPTNCLPTSYRTYKCPSTPQTAASCAGLGCKACADADGCGWCADSQQCLLAGVTRFGDASPCNASCATDLQKDASLCPSVPDCSVFDDDCAGCRQANCQLCVPDAASALAGKGQCTTRGDRRPACTAYSGIVITPDSALICPARNCSAIQGDCASCTAAGCEFCPLSGSCYPQYTSAFSRLDDLCGSGSCSVDSGSERTAAASCPATDRVCESIPENSCKDCLDSGCGFCAQSGKCFTLRTGTSSLAPRTCVSGQCKTFDSSFSTDDIRDQLYIGDSRICPEAAASFAQPVIVASLILGLLAFCCGTAWVLKPTSNPAGDTASLINSA